MTPQTLIEHLTETLLAVLKLPGDDETYDLVYSAVENGDEVETPDPHLQAVFVVEAVETGLHLGLDEAAYDAAVAAVMALLPTKAELELRWRADNAWRRAIPRPEMAPDAHLEAAYEDRVNGGGLTDFD